MALPVTVYSDYSCPFCFIGKARLEALAKEFPLTVEWKGLQLHPEIPAAGWTLEELFGEHALFLWGHAQKLANESHLVLRRPSKVVNSRLAHLGAEFARAHGRFSTFHDKLFRAYFQQGLDIGDLSVLSRLAAKAGLPVDAFEESLVEGRDERTLLTGFREALIAGIEGVPTILLGPYRVVGAQPLGVFRAVLELLEVGEAPSPNLPVTSRIPGG